MNTSDATYNEAVIDKLLEAPLLRDLDRPSIRRLLRRSRIKEYKPGDLIVEDGKYDTHVYYLISGKVEAVKQGVPLMTIQERGSVFGEMAGIDGASRSASVYAIDHAMCISLDLAVIDQLDVSDQLELKFRIYKKISEVLAIRLRHSTDELVRTTEELSSVKAELEMLKRNAGAGSDSESTGTGEEQDE